MITNHFLWGIVGLPIPRSNKRRAHWYLFRGKSLVATIVCYLPTNLEQLQNFDAFRLESAEDIDVSSWISLGEAKTLIQTKPLPVLTPYFVPT